MTITNLTIYQTDQIDQLRLEVLCDLNAGRTGLAFLSAMFAAKIALSENPALAGRAPFVGGETFDALCSPNGNAVIGRRRGFVRSFAIAELAIIEAARLTSAAAGRFYRRPHKVDARFCNECGGGGKVGCASSGEWDPCEACDAAEVL